MKTKILFIITTILSASTILAQSNTEDEGVIINGVKWATRNVDMPGTFAETPESAGKFYQWNRKVAWNTTDSLIVNWDNTMPEDTIWTRENDPCPTGWRVPTLEEIASFLFGNKEVSSECTIQNDVNGRKFTDKENGNSIFLPAVGFRNYNFGTLSHQDFGKRNVSMLGNYWSNAPYENIHAAYLLFHSNEATFGASNRANGRSVRCVAE